MYIDCNTFLENYKKHHSLIKTQCKSLKSLAKGHGPRTYIILNPCNIFDI